MIQSYGEGRIRISGQVYEHPVLVFPEAVLAWPLEPEAVLAWTLEDRLSPFDLTSLEAVRTYQPQVEILLIGCGPRMLRLPTALRASLREAGLAADAMDSGAACRTYNVLLAEDRRVAAAIIPV